MCAFANPLEIDHHSKTEAGAIMEGKYWKRKMATILAEYKKWRLVSFKRPEIISTSTMMHKMSCLVISYRTLSRIFYKNQNDAHGPGHFNNRVFYQIPDNSPPNDVADIGDTFKDSFPIIGITLLLLLC